MFKFTEQDIEKYKGVIPDWGQVGAVTYKRTYSRPIKDSNGNVINTEDWLDTCVRVIEGNMNLIKDDPTATREWALEALDLMFNMGWLPPGRGLWMLGTDYSYTRGGDSLNNCWYVDTVPQSYEDMEMFKGTYVFSEPNAEMPSFPFVFMFDRAMLGGGVGFGIGKDNLSKYSNVKSRVNIKIYLGEEPTDWDRIISSEEWKRISDSVVVDKRYVTNKEYVVINIPDSREGWDIAIRELIDSHWCVIGPKDEIPLVFDLSAIRGYGESISGFGGTASGTLPLMDAMVYINNILNSKVGRNLSSTDALDIMNILGRCVVSGNVRRTALIALGDPTDKNYLEAKNYTLVSPIIDISYGNYGWYTNKWGRMTQKLRPKEDVIKEYTEKLFKETGVSPTNPGLIAKATSTVEKMYDTFYKQNNHRWASNNSVYTTELFEDFHFISAGMIANGEPGIVNKWLIQNYGRIIDGYQEGIDKDANGVNPCFRGDMKILTTEGYKTFEELCDTEVDIINAEGKTSHSKIWCSGTKNIVEIRFDNRESIFCTPDHRFMTSDRKEVEAKDLKGKKLLPFSVESDNDLINNPLIVTEVISQKQKCLVYDFTEPLTHWGVVEGVVAHNCGEITLANGEPCNLAEVIPYMCHKKGFDIFRALKIATEYTYRITFAKYSWKATQRVIESNRRIGVSLTGMQDYFLSKYNSYPCIGFEDNDITKPIYNQLVVDELDSWYNFVKKTNMEHSELLSARPSIKLTTCKPSGTVAKIPGVSSGIHWHYSRFLIQRIRFHESDPNLGLLRVCGYPIEKDAKAPNTWVVEFPVKSPNADNENFKSSGEVPLEEQFANQSLFAYAWADNAVSATLTFKPEEQDKIEPLLKAYNTKIKSTSLLPYAGHGYVQAPWEPISEEEYNRRIKEIKMPIEKAYTSFTFSDISDLMDSDCVGGACPIR